jgi:1-acyl-sn-glycerol-3-phosphate acyltransferase
MRLISIIYLNVTFYSAFLLFSAVYIPLMTVAVVAISLFRPRKVLLRNFRAAIVIYGKVVTHLGYPLVRLRVEDRSGVDLRKGPFIFIINHRSSSDPFLVSTLPIGTELVQVVNKWPFRIPVIGFLARLADYIDINSISFDEFMDQGRRLLSDGVSIVFFPEGTRSGGLEMGQFRSAAFRLFLDSRAPIVPVCVSGNEDIPHKGSLKLNPGTVKMRYLPPLRWEDHGGSNAYKVKTFVREMIGSELRDMDARA